MKHSLIILTSLLIFLNSFQALSFQNVDQVLADPDVTWVGEVYVDYLPNIPVIEPLDTKIVARYGINDYNNFEILKIQSPVNENWLNPSLSQLSNKFLQISPNNLTVYEDGSLTKKLSYEEYKNATKYVVLDTIITLDPETHEEIVQVVVNFLTPKDIVLFRVKQILTYNAKTNQLNIIPVAIAPIATTTGRKDTIRRDILFWVPIKEMFKHLNLDAASIDWAKRLTKDIPSKTVKTIKGTEDLFDIFDQMLSYYKKNSATSKLYFTHGDQLSTFSSKEIEDMGHTMDTTINFDSETFEEIVQIVHHHLPTRFAVKFRLIQDWVWDNKAQKMQVRTLGFAPLIHKLDLKIQYDPVFHVKHRE